MKLNREKIIKFFLALPLWILIFITFVILIVLLDGSFRFIQKTSLFDFLFDLEWNPFSTITSYSRDYEGNFGILPLLLGSFLVTFMALLYAIPLSVFSAIFLSEYVSSRWTNFLKPCLELLAGIPTIVYGFFAVLVLSPYVQEIGNYFGLDVSTENVLSASIVMGIMLIPYMLSTSLDVFEGLPQTMREASYAMGATKWETIQLILFPAAWPTILSSILLGLSRALGETMIVVMALGLSASLTLNPLESSTTITVQILSILTGDQEFDSPKTLVTFALALALFLFTFLLNAYAHKRMRRSFL